MFAGGGALAAVLAVYLGATISSPPMMMRAHGPAEERGIVLASASGVSSSPSVDRIVAGALPDVQEMVEGVLPPPPDKAVLQTKMFGTITVDHRAHLARHISCKRCHGPGVISKLTDFPMKVAHERCVGCHKEEQRGPTKCRDCHVPRDAPAGAAQVAQSAPAEQDAAASLRAQLGDDGRSQAVAKDVASPAKRQPGAPASAALGVAASTTGRPSWGNGELAAADQRPPAATVRAGTATTTITAPGPAAAPALLGSFEPRPTSHRAIEVAFTRFSGAEGGSMGVGARITSETNGVHFSESFEALSGSAAPRLLGLVGPGLSRDVHRNVRVFGTALVGFDTTLEPAVTVAPALGARVGIELSGRFLLRNTLAISAVALSDLSGGRTVVDQRVGGFTFGVGASLGVRQEAQQ